MSTFGCNHVVILILWLSFRLPPSCNYAVKSLTSWLLLPFIPTETVQTSNLSSQSAWWKTIPLKITSSVHSALSADFQTDHANVQYNKSGMVWLEECSVPTWARLEQSMLNDWKSIWGRGFIKEEWTENDLNETRIGQFVTLHLRWRMGSSLGHLLNPALLVAFSSLPSSTA